MRLDRYKPNNVDVGRSGGGFPGGGGGRLGCGAIVIALIGALVFGIDPAQMLGTMGALENAAPSEQRTGQTADQLCNTQKYALEACNALSSLNDTWQPKIEQAGIRFRQPGLRFYTGGTNSGCGSATSAAGPFYCPTDQRIYIDTSFYDQLERQLGAGGDFARYYVVAHEYGHHIQALTGLADQVRSAQQQNPQAANRLQVAMELQADCYAGVWAGRNRDRIEPGDIEEGLTAAHAIGDDVLTGGRASESAFTHGSAAQRMEWLRRGIQTADEDRCDTLAEFRR